MLFFSDFQGPVTCGVCNTSTPAPSIDSDVSFLDNFMSMLDNIDAPAKFESASTSTQRATTTKTSESTSSASSTTASSSAPFIPTIPSVDVFGQAYEAVAKYVPPSPATSKSTTQATTSASTTASTQAAASSKKSTIQYMIKEMRPNNAPCEDFNHEFCKLIITPELCNENYYINDRKAIESCKLILKSFNLKWLSSTQNFQGPVTCNVCKPTGRLAQEPAEEKKTGIVKPVVVEAASAVTTTAKSVSIVCDDLIPTCHFLKIKCSEIQKFVPHPCMRTCNLCPWTKENMRWNSTKLDLTIKFTRTSKAEDGSGTS